MPLHFSLQLIHATGKILHDLINKSCVWNEDENAKPYLVMQFIDVVIYTAILAIIEKARVAASKKATKMKFGSYTEFFEEAKTVSR